MARAHIVYTCTGRRGDGTPVLLSGATVNVYEQGTTGAIADTIYSAASGSTALTQPLTSNAAGAIEFFLDTEKFVDLRISKTGWSTLTETVLIAAPGNATPSAHTHSAAEITDLGTTYQVASLKDAASGYAGLTASSKLSASVVQEVIGISDLTDATITSAAGGDALQRGSSGWVNAHHSYNVRAYGATGDGTTDDTTAINAASTAANNAGVGTVYFPRGTYITSGITVYRNVDYCGAGEGVTTVKLKDSSAAGSHVFATDGFATDTQTIAASYTTGEWEFKIRKMTIDGNVANNASGGHGLALYGYGYHLDRLMVQNCHGAGWWSEWTLTTEPVNAGVGSTNQRGFICGKLRFKNNAGADQAAANTRSSEGRAVLKCGQVALFGPGDSSLENIEIFKSGTVAGTGFYLGTEDFTAATHNCFHLSVGSFTVWGNHAVACDIAGNNLKVQYHHIEGGFVNVRLSGIGGPKLLDGIIFNARPGFTRSSTTANGSPTVTVTTAGSGADIVAGMAISGTGIAADTFITAVTSTTITLSKNATSSATNTLTYIPTEIAVIGSTANFTEIRTHMLDNANNTTSAKLCTTGGGLTESTIIILGEISGAETNYLGVGALPTACREIDIVFDDYSGGAATVTPGWIPGPTNIGAGISYRLYRRHTPLTMPAATATASAGAATLHASAGTVTSEALTTAAGSDYVLTLTNTNIASTSHVFASVDNGTNTTEGLAINRVTPSSGQVVIRVRNTHASSALNGTIKVNYLVIL